MADSYLPLRWEGTGDQWWYASPIDWAAANGHYDLVRELLHIDSNLLIKLTSLRRIRRLETVWDDDARFADAARCRSEVARRLFLECDTTGGKKNSLISAGYGGWLMYSAASAGDARFIRELLDRDPLLVFGEGEYGVSDILYAAARGKSSDVFRLIRDLAVSPRCPDGAAWSRPGGQEDNIPTFEWEITNRAAHAAARGGNLEMLRELLSTCSDPLDFRDAQGSTVLHAAAGRGQVEVAKWLLAVSSEFIDSKDQHGNTALHVAALRGQLPVLRTLATASPACVGGTNNDGDTLLHVAVAGFRHPGFRRLDRQMELVRWLAADNEAMVNARNGDGRTALHVAAAGDVPAELVELLLAVRGIEPNIQDGDGMTALDLLRRRPRSPATEVLIRRVATAGGTLTSSQRQHRPAVKTARQLRFPASPGTVFGVPDEEIFLLFSGLAGDRRGWRSSSCASSANSEPSSAGTGCSAGTKKKKKNKRSTVLSAAKHLKLLLTWPRRNGGTVGRRAVEDSEGDDGSSDLSGKWCSDNDDVPTPLRQRFSQPASLHANKRVLAQPSTSLPERGAAGPTDRSRRTTPQPSPPCSISSSLDEQQEDIWRDVKGSTGSKSSSSTNSRKATAAGTIEGRGFRNSRLITGYLCFRTMMPESGEGRRLGGFFRRS